MDSEKRLVDGYEIIQSVKIDGMEIVVGEKQDAREPYMMWRIHRRPDAALTAKDCAESGMDEDLKGKVVAIRADALSPEYRARSHQLLLAESGFGCAPDARGRAVFGVNIYSGARERWDRSDILGVVAENALPDWAREKLAILRKPAEKESVLGRIKEDRQAAKPRKPKQNKHDKSGPEL